MSKVKFIQLGEKEKLVKNGTEENNYENAINGALNDYPGAIIFATYYESATSTEKQQEIYANGVKYSVGGGGGGTVYVGTIMPGANGVINTPKEGTAYQFYKDYWKKTDSGDNATNDTIPYKFKEGDVYIYNPNGDREPLKSTGFAHTNKRWEALAGSVDAENVWFNNGVERTEKWGSATSENATPTVECKGLNLKALLENYLVKSKFTPSTADYGNINPGVCTGTVAGFTHTQTQIEFEMYSSVTDTITYDPTVTKTKGCIEPGPVKFGPNTAKNTTGYKNQKDDGGYIKGNKTGESVTPIATVGTFTKGNGKLSIKIDSTLEATTDYTKGSSASCEVTYKTDVLGLHTINASATNDSKCSITWALNNSTVTEVTVPKVSEYPVTNKGLIPTHAEAGTSGQENGFTVEAKTYPLPSQFTYDNPAKDYTYQVYLPVYWYKDTNVKAKYFGRSCAVLSSVQLGLAMPDNCNNWYIEYPATATPTVTVAGRAVTQCTTSSVSKTINGQTVKYTRWQFTNSAAYTADAIINFTIK